MVVEVDNIINKKNTKTQKEKKKLTAIYKVKMHKNRNTEIL